MPRTLVVVLCLLAAACNSTPDGYRRIEPVVKLQRKVVAFVPFQVQQKTKATPIDGIKLAELAGAYLRSAVPGSKVITPSMMRDVLAEGMDESRWTEIGKEIGADLLCVGEINYLESQLDKLLQSHEGVIGIEFRVLDLSKSPPKLAARVRWRLSFPENPNNKFDPQFVTMDEQVFRHEMIRFTGRKVAGLFYAHNERIMPVSQLDVRWQVE